MRITSIMVVVAQVRKRTPDGPASGEPTLQRAVERARTWPVLMERLRAHALERDRPRPGP